MKRLALLLSLIPTLAFADIIETAKGTGSAVAIAVCKHGRAVAAECHYESAESVDTPLKGTHDELKGIACAASGDGAVSATAIIRCESRAVRQTNAKRD